MRFASTPWADAAPSAGAADSDDTDEAGLPSPTSVQRGEASPLPQLVPTAAATARRRGTAELAEWPTRPLPRRRGGRARRMRGGTGAKATRPVVLSRVTILSASVGGVPAPPPPPPPPPPPLPSLPPPPTQGQAVGAAVDDAIDALDVGCWWAGLPPPPPRAAVAAAVDAEIDRLEGAGWWVCSPPPAALVRAASDDVSADAELWF